MTYMPPIVANAQVMSVTDVSKPTYASSNPNSRLLVLKLHDGRSSCKAMEQKTCPQLTDSLAPGSKVRAGAQGLLWTQRAFSPRPAVLAAVCALPAAHLMSRCEHPNTPVLLFVVLAKQCL